MSISDRQLPIDRLVDFELREARHAYETGGQEGLAAHSWTRLHSVYRGRAYLTDGPGATCSPARTAPTWCARSWASAIDFVLFTPRGGLMLARTADDGRLPAYSS